MDYLKLYDLESYLFNKVGVSFRKHGSLTAFDFFCIVIWKAERAKSAIAARLLKRGHSNLDAAVSELSKHLAAEQSAEERLRYLWDVWGFRLPMATAILTVLYPGEFTIYDRRVCDSLNAFHKLANRTNFASVWSGYLEFRDCVSEKGCVGQSLREKDRYLWAKSFHDDLQQDIANNFARSE